MEINLTDRLLAELAELDDSIQSGLGAKLDLEVKCCLIDYVAALSAGISIQSGLVNSYLNWIGSGHSPIYGTSRACDIYNAAFLMALQAHAAEIDDGHRKGMIHPGVPIFSAVLALLPVLQPSWNAIRRSVILGYQASISLALLAQPHHKKSGFHATATCGAAGAAIAALSLISEDRMQWRSALGISLSGANGLLETMNKESELKPVNAARASMLGLQAAALAACGLRGPWDIVGGERGFLTCMAQGGKDGFRSSVNITPHILEIYRKPYSSCRHCHPGVEAAIKISHESGFNIKNVQSVLVETYDLAIKGHTEALVETVAAAKMSIPYCVAFALATGRGDCFKEDFLCDNEIKKIVSQMKVVDRGYLSELVPEKRPAVVSVQMKNSATYSVRVDYPKGEPENPMSIFELKSKFLNCLTALHLDGTFSEGLFESLLNIGEDADISHLFFGLAEELGGF